MGLYAAVNIYETKQQPPSSSCLCEWRWWWWWWWCEWWWCEWWWWLPFSVDSLDFPLVGSSSSDSESSDATVAAICACNSAYLLFSSSSSFSLAAFCCAYSLSNLFFSFFNSLICLLDAQIPAMEPTMLALLLTIPTKLLAIAFLSRSSRSTRSRKNQSLIPEIWHSVTVVSVR